MRYLIAGILLSLGVAAPAQAFQAAEPFVANRDAVTFERSLECLTQAIYYEARSQSDDGQRAVAQVVLNRVRHPAYPSSVCGVVYQGSHRVTGCQFTFTCDGSLFAGIEPGAWERARRIATAALRGSVYRPVGLALNYHTLAIRPYWAPSLVQQAVIGSHIFYLRPGSATLGSFTQRPSSEEPEPGAQNYYAGVTTRQNGGSIRYERPVLEIPVVERPVMVRTISQRSGATASRASDKQPAVRQAPRSTIQNGVRVLRGS
jgi:hypothetical protein